MRLEGSPSQRDASKIRTIIFGIIGFKVQGVPTELVKTIS